MKNKQSLVNLTSFLVIICCLFICSGCQKDVGVITNIVRYNISGYVLDAGTAAGIEGVSIHFGDTVLMTDTAGKYTLPMVMPGTYLIVAEKEGYSEGRYNMTVTSDGVIAKSILLKELAPPVVIGTAGGSATATNSTGTTVAELTIPAGELSSDKSISVTNLAGNEVPKILDEGDKLLGTTITLHADDDNLAFENGATLTFKLPFRHRPGDVVEVTYFNDSINEWETYDDAVVNADGITASITINHFSTFSANINGSFETDPDVNYDYNVIGTSDDYEESYEWESGLEYRAEVTDSIDHEWLYTTVENQVALNFSSITYGSSTKAASVIRPVKNRIGIPPPPSENPDGFRDMPPRHWELLKVCCWFHELVAARRWIDDYNGYVVTSVPNWYLVCAYIWVWRPSDLYPLINDCYPNPPIIIIIIDIHGGGSGD